MSENKKQADVYIIKIMLFIVLIVVAIVVCGVLYINVFKNDAGDGVIIVKDESWHNNFQVTGDEVHISCIVSLKNNSSDMKKVKLVGSFPREVEIGLLKEGSLEAYFIKDAADSITLEGNSAITNIEIEFVGEYAGNSQMSSKLLPDMEVVEVQ